MKFKGEPNLTVRINKPFPGEVKSFQFDEDGFYETNHPMTTKRLKAIYEEVIEEVEKEDSETKPLKHCKKCDFTCDNQGELLAHYREVHPKEGK